MKKGYNKSGVRMNGSRFLEAETFLAVADYGGFGAAARELGVTQSTISRRIAALEARVNHKLIERTTRRVALTEDGLALAVDLRDVLARLADAESRIHAGTAEPQGTLSITMPTAYGRACVLPRLAALAAAHPQLQFRLDLSDRYADLLDDGYDLAVRFSASTVTGVKSQKIDSFGVAICASPEYLAVAGMPQMPDDLASHACIIQQVYAPRTTWPFEWKGRPVEIAIKPRFVVSDMAAIAELTVSGAGISALPSYLIENDVAAGRLVRLLPSANLPTIDVFAAYPHQKAKLGKVVAALAELSRVEAMQ